MYNQTIEILNKVKSGELSVEEGARRLQSFEASETNSANAEILGQPVIGQPGEENPADLPLGAETPWDAKPSWDAVAPRDAEPSQEEEFQPDLGWWKKAWLIPFWVGTGILVLGALLMGWAFSSQHFFWFYCSWMPMLFGLGVLFLSWWSQQARWVHVRVKDANGSRVAISLPLPLGLAGWALRVFGRYIPNLEKKVLDELPDILTALDKEKGPTMVEVNEKDGSRVRVYIL